MLSLILLLALGFTWGTSFSIAKFAMESGVTPLGYAFWQSVGPAVLISAFSLLKERQLFVFSMQRLRFYFLCGLIGICLPNLSMYFAATHVPSGILGLIVNTSPIITYVLTLLFHIERFFLPRFLGVLLGMVGVSLLFYSKVTGLGDWRWMAFTFVTPALLAVCTVYMVKARPQGVSSITLSAGMLLAAALLTAPMTFYKHEFHSLLALNTPNLIILLEIGLSSLGYILFFELLRVAGPVYYSLVGCIVALAGLFWGYFIFHEVPNWFEFGSILFILLAIFLVSQVRKK